MKIKFIFAVPIISILLYLIISSSSCDNENPIIPPPPITPPDTVSRFIWRTVQLYSPIWDVFPADTNDIYIRDNIGCLHYDGNSSFYYFNFQDSYFGLDLMDGYDKNNIFFLGSYVPANNVVIEKLKVLNNGVLNSYILDTSTNGGGRTLKVVGPNKAWMASLNPQNGIFYYDNGIIKNYKLENNNNIGGCSFYINKYNELYLFALKAETIDSLTIRTYKFDGKEFHLIKIDCYNGNYDNCLSLNFFHCGDDFIMSKPEINNRVYFFDGYNWLYHSSYDSSQIRAYKIGGWSKDSLIAMCSIWNNIYTFNGRVWRIENGSPKNLFVASTGFDSEIKIKNGYVYIPYYDGNTNVKCLIIGKPNKNIR
jgi:hypothetical protein